ncbi:MAG: regulatory protein RecX [Ignavibacteriaceae bacterium]
MKVTRIVKKGLKDVIVYFDNDEFLILSLAVFLKSGLKKNENVSEDRFSMLIKENISFHIKQKALGYLGRRLHSSSELRLKLIQKRYDMELINKVIEELKRTGYLNDLNFAREFTEEKARTKFLGKNKIKSELIKKGISAEIITQVLEECFSRDEEYEKAKVSAQKKLRLLKTKLDDDTDLKRKLISFLIMRGYSYEISGKVCDELIGGVDYFD